MIQEQGRILAIEPDAVWVETIRASTCQSCSVKKGCGHGLLNDAFGGRRQQVRVLTGRFRAQDLNIDDRVQIDIPEKILVGGALLVYLLPLVMLLLGAGLAQHWFAASTDAADVAAAVGAGLGLAVGFIAVTVHGRLYRHQPSYQPVVSAVLQRAAAPSFEPVGLAGK